MDIWIDAQLSPSIALWINQNFTKLRAKSLRSLELLKSSDIEIFKEARRHNVVLISKDDDFVQLVKDHGPPPNVILITCGNTSNQKMRLILEENLQTALDLIESGEPLVEING